MEGAKRVGEENMRETASGFIPLLVAAVGR
jgi:hypothetical protein